MTQYDMPLAASTPSYVQDQRDKREVLTSHARAAFEGAAKEFYSDFGFSPPELRELRKIWTQGGGENLNIAELHWQAKDSVAQHGPYYSPQAKGAETTVYSLTPEKQGEFREAVKEAYANDYWLPPSELAHLRSIWEQGGGDPNISDAALRQEAKRLATQDPSVAAGHPKDADEKYMRYDPDTGEYSFVRDKEAGNRAHPLYMRDDSTGVYFPAPVEPNYTGDMHMRYDVAAGEFYPVNGPSAGNPDHELYTFDPGREAYFPSGYMGIESGGDDDQYACPCHKKMVHIHLDGSEHTAPNRAFGDPYSPAMPDMYNSGGAPTAPNYALADRYPEAMQHMPHMYDSGGAPTAPNRAFADPYSPDMYDSGGAPTAPNYALADRYPEAMQHMARMDDSAQASSYYPPRLPEGREQEWGAFLNEARFFQGKYGSNPDVVSLSDMNRLVDRYEEATDVRPPMNILLDIVDLAVDDLHSKSIPPSVDLERIGEFYEFGEKAIRNDGMIDQSEMNTLRLIWGRATQKPISTSEVYVLLLQDSQTMNDSRYM